MPQSDLLIMAHSYVLRHKALARIYASEAAAMLGKVTGGTGELTRAATETDVGGYLQGNDGKMYRVVTPDAIMARSGVGFSN